MNKYTELFSQNLLFQNLTKSEIKTALSHFKPKITRHKKGSYIVMANNPVNEIYLILDGCVQVIYENSLGRRAIMAQYERGYSIVEISGPNFQHSFFSVLAEKNCIIAQISFESIWQISLRPGKLWSKILMNLYLLSVQKQIMNYHHLIHVCQSDIRKKILSYLLEQKNKAVGNEVIIPFSRRELASYLFINRNAMLKELAFMKKEKIIDFEDRRFIIKS